MIVNPGSAHFEDRTVGAHKYVMLIDYNDYPNAATTVASLDNNPAAVVTLD